MNKWFYFTPRDSKYPNGLTSERDIGGGRGYWKRTGSDIEIKDDHKGRKIILGYKSPFVFYHGSHPQGVETNWIMHEFTLADHPPQPLIRDNDDNLMVHLHNTYSYSSDPFFFSFIFLFFVCYMLEALRYAYA